MQGAATTEEASQGSGGQAGPRSRRRRDLSDQNIPSPIESNVQACLAKLSPEELDLVRAHTLGTVSKASSLPGSSVQSAVSENSIPPMSALRRAVERAPQEKQAALEERQKKGLVLNVMSEHHWTALSTGSGTISSKIRTLVSEELIGGNWEKVLKLSLISTHPRASESLREDAGLESVSTWRWDPKGMSEQGMNAYYQMGFYKLMNKYHELDVLDDEQLQSFCSWIEREEYLKKDAPEYRELLEHIKRA
ncbi:uncharacterized protein LOC115079610 [Rhinatrema bivittatum]|uniref:uncharacterized protein LOC115079610 n=1 Tax=Rhinatrema bivittatum TaxID=194408 RepID=UPI00112EAC08|nr:uncharacterized protein LOC115079610 [Rhinatrema bivittatum]